ncbi:hypothetical protein [Streptosporangium sp. CA-115845]|uniref:hypothetical protein n=1 Tax=Streptosporangium sp. CA-115845 TaxID=3240071 RepID=UPI003D89B9BD
MPIQPAVPSPGMSHQGTSIYYAVGYPEVVGLSGILVSPRWRTLAVDRFVDGLADFYAEIRKVTPDYIPRGASDPVLHWVDDQLRLNKALRSGRDPRIVLSRFGLSETR